MTLRTIFMFSIFTVVRFIMAEIVCICKITIHIIEFTGFLNENLAKIGFKRQLIKKCENYDPTLFFVLQKTVFYHITVKPMAAAYIVPSCELIINIQGDPKIKNEYL